MTDRTPYSVPKEPGRFRAIALAAVVHGALLALLWIGIRWQSETPVATEAEIWSMAQREAAPMLPTPKSEPEPLPPPKPEVKEKPQPVEPEIEKPDPEIAIAQEKKRRELEKKREQERLDKEKKRKEEEERAEKDKKEKAEKDRKEKQKQEDLAEARAEAQEKKRKEAAALDKKRKQDAADNAVLQKMREEEMRRLTGGVAGSGGSGQAERSEGSRADASYLQKVAAKIRSNTIFNAPETLSGNPAVEYDVELLPDGSLRGEPRLRKPSGVPGFDAAVKRAIEKSQPFPPDKSGAAPGRFTVIHKPKDQ